jgi:internalin A
MALVCGCTDHPVLGGGHRCPISDPALAAAVAHEAQMENVSEADVAYLTVSGVADLRGIDCLARLQLLDMRASTVSDLSPLAGNPTLVNLIIGQSNVVDLGPVGSIAHLANLSINDSPFEDVSPLGALAELGTLALRSPRLKTLG